MTFVKRQHVLLRLMFLLVLIFFSLFAASSSFFFFFFLNLTFCIFLSLWAVSFLSATFACHNVGRYLRNQRNWTFLSGA